MLSFTFSDTDVAHMLTNDFCFKLVNNKHNSSPNECSQFYPFWLISGKKLRQTGEWRQQLVRDLVFLS